MQSSEEIDEYHALLDLVRVAICITDPSRDDNPIVYANPAFLELTGYDLDEVLGRNCSFLQGSGTAASSIQAIRDGLSSEKPFSVEIVNYRKDGSKFSNGLQIAPIYNRAGKLRYHFGSQLDVTCLAEARISASERNAAPVTPHVDEERAATPSRQSHALGTFDADLHTGVTKYNRRNLEIHGVDSPQMLDDYEQSIHPQDRDVFRAVMEHNKRPGVTPLPTRYRYFSKREKRYLWLESQSQGIFQDGQSVRMSGTMRDITDEVEAKEKLEQIEARRKRANEAGGIGTWEYDVLSDSTVWDEECRDLFGIYSPGPIALDDLRAIINRDDLANWEGDVARALDPHGTLQHEAEFRITRPDNGQERWIKARGETIVEDGVGVRMIGTVQDITAEMDKDRVLRRQRERLALALRAGEQGIWEFVPDVGGSVWDERCFALFGIKPKPLMDLSELVECLHEDDRAPFTANVEAALDPDGDGIHSGIFRAFNQETGEPFWFKTDGRTFFENGVPVRMIGAIQDVSEIKGAQERLNILNRELHHRVKNLFATMNAMIRLSARDVPGAETYVESLTGRVQALGSAHLLSMDDDGTAPVALNELVNVVLKPYRAGDHSRINIDVADIDIGRDAVTPMGLILHELATNAAKYGALCAKDGRLEVTVREVENEAGDERQVRLLWRERVKGGSVHDTSAKGATGFGSRLIKSSVAQMRGTIEQTFEDTGLVVELTIPRL